MRKSKKAREVSLVFDVTFLSLLHVELYVAELSWRGLYFCLELIMCVNITKKQKKEGKENKKVHHPIVDNVVICLYVE